MEIAIKQGIENAFNSKYNEIVDLKLIKLEPTNSDFRGDYTFVVFPFLKISKPNPFSQLLILFTQIVSPLHPS